MAWKSLQLLRRFSLQREKKLSDYVGKNDKTKVVAKLQKKGSGAPQREPIVSEEEQKAMVAFASCISSLNLVMSQILDQGVASIISQVLFQVSGGSCAKE